VTAPVELQLEWDGELRFRGRSGETAVVIDSASRAGPSPIEGVAFALAGCMAIDVVDILVKGRLPLRALHARLRAERAPSPPKRLTAVALHFVVTGDVPPDRVERAIALSRETYCSVWHTLRQDLPFETSFEVEKGG
jgi:putative redox protein